MYDIRDLDLDLKHVSGSALDAEIRGHADLFLSLFNPFASLLLCLSLSCRVRSNHFLTSFIHLHLLLLSPSCRLLLWTPSTVIWADRAPTTATQDHKGGEGAGQDFLYRPKRKESFVFEIVLFADIIHTLVSSSPHKLRRLRVRIFPCTLCVGECK